MKPSQLALVIDRAITCRHPLLIVGPPGVGKSDIVAQGCRRRKADLIVFHPVVSDPTDFKGLPFVVNGEAAFLPFGELNRLIAAKQPTVAFLDDLGQAPASVQAAAMQLLLARTINNHRISDQVTFIAATNRREDCAGVGKILEPVKSRFVSIVNFTVDKNDWIEWALGEKLPVELIAFIRFRPALLHDFRPNGDLVNSSCPRTVTFAGRILQAAFSVKISVAICGLEESQGFSRKVDLSEVVRVEREEQGKTEVLWKRPRDPGEEFNEEKMHLIATGERHRGILFPPGTAGELKAIICSPGWWRLHRGEAADRIRIAYRGGEGTVTGHLAADGDGLLHVIPRENSRIARFVHLDRVAKIDPAVRRKKRI